MRRKGCCGVGSWCYDGAPTVRICFQLATILFASFGWIFSARGAQIVITQQPQSMTVFETRKAKFAVDADAGGASLSYQWQRNGTNIAGATDSVLITDYVRDFDNGDRFSVVISTPGQETVISENATLTVIGWDMPPLMIHAGRRTSESAEIVVVFSSRVLVSDATSTFNWALDGGASVKEVAVGRSASEFIVTAENLVAGAAYNLTARNIRDQFGNANREQTIAVTLVSPDPVLSVAESGNALTITWHVTNYLYDPFELEFSSNVAKPDLWYPTGSVTKDGDLRSCTIQMNGKTGFFRLRRLE